MMATICVSLVCLTMVRRPWAARVLQFALLLGSVEWLRAAIFLVNQREVMGQPFVRLAVILGAVCLFTTLSSFVFQTKTLKSRFNSAANDINHLER